MSYKCIIVDDEPIARELLQKYIKQCPLLELINTFKNSEEAMHGLMLEDADLIFLDIEMPGINGIQFYKSLRNPPYVIFTTAYSEYAVEGFNLDAIDYLLKPFPYERFLQAVNKATDKLITTKSQEHCNFLLFKSDKKIYRIEIEKIKYIEALGDYIKVHCQEKTLIVYDTLKNIFKKLPDNDFIQVHKSFIVPISKIEVIKGNMLVIEQNNIPVGPSFKKDLFNNLYR